MMAGCPDHLSFQSWAAWERQLLTWGGEHAGVLGHSHLFFGLVVIDPSIPTSFAESATDLPSVGQFHAANRPKSRKMGSANKKFIVDKKVESIKLQQQSYVLNSWILVGDGIDVTWHHPLAKYSQNDRLSNNVWFVRSKSKSWYTVETVWGHNCEGRRDGGRKVDIEQCWGVVLSFLFSLLSPAQLL